MADPAADGAWWQCCLTRNHGSFRPRQPGHFGCRFHPVGLYRGSGRRRDPGFRVLPLRAGDAGRFGRSAAAPAISPSSPWPPPSAWIAVAVWSYLRVARGAWMPRPCGWSELERAAIGKVPDPAVVRRPRRRRRRPGGRAGGRHPCQRRIPPRHLRRADRTGAGRGGGPRRGEA